MEDDLAGVGGEMLEQEPFGPRQLDELAIARDHPALEVDLDVVELEDTRTRRRPGRPTQDGADPSRQLIGMERLGDVVVGAEIEALCLVGGGTLGGEQDDRDRTAFAELPQIVAVIEGRGGLTVEGIAIELVVAPPERFGTELVRATGSASVLSQPSGARPFQASSNWLKPGMLLAAIVRIGPAAIRFS